MKYELWMIGKTNEKYIVDGCNEYIKRISRFANLQVLVWTDVKVSPDMPAETVKLKEGESIIQKLGKDDYLVLLDEKGSQMNSRDFADYLEDFEWLMNINLYGVVRLSKAFLPHLIQQNKGHIVNVSSVYGLAGMPTNSAYSTAKFGVKGFTDVLKAELLGTNVKISSVHPGGIKTNIARNSRISSTQDIAQAKATMAKFEKVALKMPPAKAADVIIDGIKKDKSRILIGTDAKALDFIVRLFPNSYHKIIAKVFKV